MAQNLASPGTQLLARTVAYFVELPDRIASSVADWQERDMLQRELAELGAHGELDRILSDAHLSRSDLPVLLKNGPAARRQLSDMFEHLEIADGHRQPTALMREICWRCMRCETRKRCRQWLASGKSDDGFREFCPNAEEFCSLRLKRVERVGAGHKDIDRPSL